MKVCVLGSGSQGNSVFIKLGDTSFLVDAGFSYRETEKRLRNIGESISSIQHIFITHEHEDHVKGLPGFIRRSSAMFYMSPGTYLTIGSFFRKNVNLHLFESSFILGDLSVNPFSISHDAVEPVAFSFEAYGQKICVATDLGYASPLVVERLKDCDVLVLESNHDEGLLMRGPYPWSLKQRIASRIGHLSNRQAGELARIVASEKLKYLFLAHRSEANNSIRHAHENMVYSLSGRSAAVLNTFQEKISEPVTV